MKRFVLFGLGIFWYSLLAAQDIKNIFVYRHVIPRGNIPRLPKNNGTNNGAPQPEVSALPQFNYFIFVSVTNQKNPVISKLSIGEKLVKVRLEKIKDYPVVYTYYDGSGEQKITMIDSKQKNVYQLVLPDDIITNTVSGSATKIAVNYQIAGKIKTKTTTVIKEMPASVVY